MYPELIYELILISRRSLVDLCPRTRMKGKASTSIFRSACRNIHVGLMPSAIDAADFLRGLAAPLACGLYRRCATDGSSKTRMEARPGHA